VEAIECPTMLTNGYGEHNIQGIGDKHIPLIHNVMNTDLVVGVSDQSSDALNLLFNDSVGRLPYTATEDRSRPAECARQHRPFRQCQHHRRDQIAKRLELGSRTRSSRSRPTVRRCTTASELRI
jgi:hypothetical protein